MGLMCAEDDYGDYEWWWEGNFSQLSPLATKRSRKCCSCGERIAVGEEAAQVHRYRAPENDIEKRIYGDIVPKTSWYACERCSDLALSLEELGFCFTLGGGESLAQQIRDYRALESRGRV